MSKYNSRKLRRFQNKLVRVTYSADRDGFINIEKTTATLIGRSRKGATVRIMNEDPTITLSYKRLINVELPYISK